MLLLVFFGVIEYADGFLRCSARQPQVKRKAKDDDRDRLESLMRLTTTPGSDKTTLVPLLEAPWTYLPGVREVLRVQRPALTYLFKDVVLPSASKTYVHALAGAGVGLEMRCLDSIEQRDELYVLVHCLRRVTFQRESRKVLPFVSYAPFFDAEEDEKDFEVWSDVDDPIDDWLSNWFLDGGARRRHPPFFKSLDLSPESGDDLLEDAESELWRTLDAFVALVRKSRTSGRFDLPPPLMALRNPPENYPLRRRAQRLSFLVAKVLELDRASDRQVFLDCETTAARLHMATAQLSRDSRALQAALSLEAIRDNKKNEESSKNTSS